MQPSLGYTPAGANNRIDFREIVTFPEFLGDFDREGLGRSHAGAMNQSEFRETCSCNILDFPGKLHLQRTKDVESM